MKKPTREKRMAIIANIRRLHKLMLEKADLLVKLERALMREWEKGDVDP